MNGPKPRSNAGNILGEHEGAAKVYRRTKNPGTENLRQRSKVPFTKIGAACRHSRRKIVQKLQESLPIALI